MIFFNQGKAYIYQDKWVVKTVVEELVYNIV